MGSGQEAGGGEFQLLQQRISYEREIADLREQHHADALKLQAAEYERRLQDLNHEASRLQAAVADNVSADTWRGFMTAYEKDHDTTAGRFRSMERFQNKLLGAIALAVIVAPFLAAALTYMLTRHAIPVQK